MLFSIAEHAINVALIQRCRTADGYLLLLACRHVLGRDVEDAVGIDVVDDFDLGQSSWRGAMPSKRNWPACGCRVQVRALLANT